MTTTIDGATPGTHMHFVQSTPPEGWTMTTADAKSIRIVQERRSIMGWVADAWDKSKVAVLATAGGVGGFLVGGPIGAALGAGSGAYVGEKLNKESDRKKDLEKGGGVMQPMPDKVEPSK